tara:strand:- start:792 stop:968 length:177 start_codon:yes stop_codon:yes gene_type:complete
MNFKFKCDLCKKEVKRGKKFTVESTEWETESEGSGVFANDTCNACHTKIENKINSMRK